ncbi:MAG TPA: apolipoprotein N-acyltransferase [Fimbriimonas sp.]|nr:apolipoprotein N-acyltransferase [Fimbriimonas sp.]
MSRAKAALPAICSALLLLLAFPPFNLEPLVFVALAPWLVSLEGARTRGAWRRGYIFGLTFGLGQLHFIYELTARWTGSIGLGMVPWLIASVLMALYFGLAGLVIAISIRKRWLWAIPLLWAGIEVFRSYLPVFAFPWGLLASPLWRFPILIQCAHWGTIYLVSAWVVAINLLWLGLRKKGYRPMLKRIGAVSFVVAAVSVGTYLLPSNIEQVPVTIGQTGIDMAFGDPDLQRFRTDQQAARMVEQGLQNKSRLLVLPEGIAGVRGAPPFRLPFALDSRLPTLFGAERFRDSSIYQSAIGFDGDWKFADKTRLVIFGEFVPARDYLPFLKEFHLPNGDLNASDRGTQMLTLGSLPVGPLICFEGLFPDLAYKQAHNGAHLLAVMSNDDWFMDTSAPAELRIGSIWRAVETGLPLVRAGSLGHSLAIDGRGRVIAEAPLGRPFALQVNVPVPKEPISDWWLPVFPLVSLAFLVSVPIAAKRSGSQKQ